MHNEELCWQVERARHMFDHNAHDIIGHQIVALLGTERPDLDVVYGWADLAAESQTKRMAAQDG